jgi:DNA phosphorothioation-dependent restriction protein DptG
MWCKVGLLSAILDDLFLGRIEVDSEVCNGLNRKERELDKQFHLITVEIHLVANSPTSSTHRRRTLWSKAGIPLL